MMSNLTDDDRAFGVVSMAEWKRRHPQRFRELIREGLAARERRLPGDARRRSVAARAAAVALGRQSNGPTEGEKRLVAELRLEGLSLRRISHMLGYSGNRVCIWRRKGLVKCS